MIEIDLRNKVEELIKRGQVVLDDEQKKCLYDGRTTDTMSTDQIRAIYKSWRKEYDELIAELEENGVANLPKDSAKTELSIISWAREDGYYKVKHYWQQHIEELKNIARKN